MPDLEYHKLLLNFYSAELNSHSRMLIGFAVILFTLAEIAHSNLTRPVMFSQYLILVFSMVFASFAFWFILMRQLVYGVLINRILHTEGELHSFKEAHDRVTHDTINKRETIFLFIPVSLFISVGSEYRKWYIRPLGGFVCIFFASCTTFILFLLLNLV